MKPEVFFGEGTLGHLDQILRKISPSKVFLVTGKTSYSSSGAKSTLDRVLHKCNLVRFWNFSLNPTLEDANEGVELYRAHKPDLVIAIGGGSVLDMAKLINIFAANPALPLDQPELIRVKGAPLIAVPTTSGSGSEATQFAVVYASKVKHSVDHPYLLPDFAVVDPTLTHSMSAIVTATSGLDALSQGIESFWSLKSTNESKAYAAEAIRLAIRFLETAVWNPSDREARWAMAKAAHLAGRAISISRTTAPHAISYALTAYFGVPHGHAVALALGPFLIYNCLIQDEDAADPRGTRYVQQTMFEILELLGVDDLVSAYDRVSRLITMLGLETSLTALGVRESDIDLLVQSVNLERLANNPRMVTNEVLGGLLREML